MFSMCVTRHPHDFTICSCPAGPCSLNLHRIFLFSVLMYYITAAISNYLDDIAHQLILVILICSNLLLVAITKASIKQTVYKLSQYSLRVPDTITSSCRCGSEVYGCTMRLWRHASRTVLTLSGGRRWTSKRSHVSVAAPRSS